MITINLQWFAYPIWAWAVFKLSHGLFMGVPALFGQEIEPMIGVVILVQNLVWAAGLGLLGLLVWMAFRPRIVPNEQDSQRDH
jgi:hypothetical protein